jgi:uncharacterized protein YpmB
MRHNRKKWIILSIIVVVLIVSFTIGWSRIFKKSEISVSGEKVALQISAPDLLKAYETEEDGANLKYNGKIIGVTGIVSEVKEDQQNVSVYLKEKDATSGVMCSFDKSAVNPKDMKPGQQIKLKGICTGYLMDVLLNKCALE